MDTQNNFAWVEWIVDEREKREWSQSDLARKVGVSRQTINDYESRRRVTPDEGILSRISVEFGYPDDYLPRLAGLLPARRNEDEGQKRLDHLYSTLKNKSNKERAVDFLEHLVDSEKKSGKRKTP